VRRAPGFFLLFGCEEYKRCLSHRISGLCCSGEGLMPSDALTTSFVPESCRPPTGFDLSSFPFFQNVEMTSSGELKQRPRSRADSI